ncbi:hypothetical protein [Bacillus sp. NPDC077027]|uniref:hypothetical protein n=1 Tax=Bacillus sp. NPDC077027 TaxID=3390548 RepID=UPI003D07BF53
MLNEEKDQKQSKLAREETPIDQETRQSRLSRSASRQARKPKKTQASDDHKSTFRRMATSVGQAFKRYGTYALAMLKSPAKAIERSDQLRMKYAWISIVLFSVFFALGNYFQLKASKDRLLGFGVSFPFAEAFFTVGLFTFVLVIILMLTAWFIGKYMLKGPMSLKEIVMTFGAALVPVMVLSILWFTFAIINVPYVTVMISIMMFFGLHLIVFLLFRAIQAKAEEPRGDLMYAIWLVLLIELALVAALWSVIGPFVIPSLIPVHFG